jgi:hypothetical protein
MFYEVVTDSGRNVAARISLPENGHFLASAIYWYGFLKPRGLPVQTTISDEIESGVFEIRYKSVPYHSLKSFWLLVWCDGNDGG